MQQIGVDFFVGVRGGASMGSWEGGGSLVAAGDSVVPWGGDAACHDGNCTMVWCNNLLYFRHGTNVTHSIPRVGDIGQCWMRRRWTKSSRRGEASATCRGVISGPPKPVLGKKHVELFLGMYDS